MRSVLVACAAALVGCATASPVGALRFANQPPVTRVNDRADVPAPPPASIRRPHLDDLDAFYVRALTRALDVRDPHRATDVNAMDELPDSTWFHNRIGVRALSPDELRRGPGAADGPDGHLPWTVIGARAGASLSLSIRDASGRAYTLLFDRRGYPELETAADVIAQRIFWACGWNVPDDRIVTVRRRQLVVADGATVDDGRGSRRPLSRAALDQLLGALLLDPSAPLRAVARRGPDGVALGGWAGEGVRAGDPNDVIAHEDRRAVRGLGVVAAWVGHVDLGEATTRDLWVADATDPARHYVAHYLWDFRTALGARAYVDRRPDAGFARSTDLSVAIGSLVSLGAWLRPWEGIRRADRPGVGLFEADRFDPARFTTRTPYLPAGDADRFDGFWAARLVARFTPAQLQAIAEAAGYSHADSTAYVVSALRARQRRIARYWFARVAPLDRLAVAQPGTLCFDDLLLTYRLGGAATTRYQVELFDYRSRAVGWEAWAAAAPGGRTCVSGVRPGPIRGGYVIARITVWRGKRALPPLEAHLADDPATHRLRVIGLRRR